MRGRADQLNRRITAGGLGGDGGGYPLAVLEGSGWASQDYAPVVVDRKSSEAGGREDGPGGGDEKPTLVDAERYTGGGEDADGVVSDKISNASIDEESSIIINKGGDSPGDGAPTGMVLIRMARAS